MSKKLCPFLMTKNDESFKCKCQEEQCAWWTEGFQGYTYEKGCSLKVMAEHLVFIKRNLEDSR